MFAWVALGRACRRRRVESATAAQQRKEIATWVLHVPNPFRDLDPHKLGCGGFTDLGCIFSPRSEKETRIVLDYDRCFGLESWVPLDGTHVRDVPAIDVCFWRA